MSRDIDEKRRIISDLSAKNSELRMQKYRDEAMVKSLRMKMMDAYLLVQRGDATQQEFDEFVSQVEILEHSIGVTENIIATTSRFIAEQKAELAEMEKEAQQAKRTRRNFRLLLASPFIIMAATLLMERIGWTYPPLLGEAVFGFAMIMLIVDMFCFVNWVCDRFKR